MSTERHVTRGHKLVLATALSIGLSGGASALLPVEGPAESWTIGMIEALAATVSAEITAFGTQLNLQLINRFDSIAAAVGVATAQEAASANEIQESIRASSERFVAAAKAEDQNDQVLEAWLNFNPAMGQGYDPCGTSAKNRTMDRAFGSVFERSQELINGDLVDGSGNMGPIDVAPGSSTDAPDQAMNWRMVMHRSHFCTQAEADAGLCELPSDPRYIGADVNAETIFQPVEAGSMLVHAQRQYIQNVIGEPDKAPEYWASGTPAGMDFQYDKNRKDSLASIPMFSLATIAASNTATANFQNRSLTPNQLLQLRVNQYFGGAEAQEWSGALTRQSQRGLLVEANKVAGLEVWLRHKQYEQNQRIEANLAALLVARSEAQAIGLEVARNQAVSGDVRRQIGETP